MLVLRLLMVFNHFAAGAERRDVFLHTRSPLSQIAGQTLRFT